MRMADTAPGVAAVIGRRARHGARERWGPVVGSDARSA